MITHPIFLIESSISGIIICLSNNNLSPLKIHKLCNYLVSEFGHPISLRHHNHFIHISFNHQSIHPITISLVQFQIITLLRSDHLCLRILTRTPNRNHSIPSTTIPIIDIIVWTSNTWSMSKPWSCILILASTNTYFQCS